MTRIITWNMPERPGLRLRHGPRALRACVVRAMGAADVICLQEFARAHDLGIECPLTGRA